MANNRLDLAGKTFNLLTAIEPVGKSKKNNILWKCQCVCGNEIIKLGSDLTRTSPPYSCGCTKRINTKIKPIGIKLPIIASGSVFGKLTVTTVETSPVYSESGRRISGTCYICKCECGTILTVRGSNLRKGVTKSCGCLKKELIINRANLKYENTNGRSGPFLWLLNIYKNNAKSRNLIWSLTDDFVYEIIKRNCRYCGAEPGNVLKLGMRTIVYNGIDRADNSLGYTENNVRPCCTNCNFLKSDLNEFDFLKKIENICNNLKLNA